MPTFAEKLHEVRKARDFTQDQLAKEMNVSRQTISHWENGRAVPDIDTIKHLSQVLDYNFLAVEETQPAPEAEEIPAPPEEESAQETPVQQMESTPRKRRFILPAVLGAVLLCAVVVVCLMMNGKPSGAQAQVSIVPMENPVHAIRWEDYPDGVGWLYEFRIEETAGVPFTIPSSSMTTAERARIPSTAKMWRSGGAVIRWCRTARRASAVGSPCRM